METFQGIDESQQQQEKQKQKEQQQQQPSALGDVDRSSHFPMVCGLEPAIIRILAQDNQPLYSLTPESQSSGAQSTFNSFLDLWHSLKVHARVCICIKDTIVVYSHRAVLYNY